MNKSRPWNHNKHDRNMRGGFRGGRGVNRGWVGTHRGFKTQWNNSEGFSGGNRYQNNYSGNGKGNYSGKSHWIRQKKESPGKRLSEEDIGVTEYISTHEGFNGIIKSRCVSCQTYCYLFFPFLLLYSSS